MFRTVHTNAQQTCYSFHILPVLGPTWLYEQTFIRNPIKHVTCFIGHVWLVILTKQMPLQKVTHLRFPHHTLDQLPNYTLWDAKILHTHCNRGFAWWQAC